VRDERVRELDALAADERGRARHGDHVVRALVVGLDHDDVRRGEKQRERERREHRDERMGAERDRDMTEL
jgi:hypothetical protein